MQTQPFISSPFLVHIRKVCLGKVKFPSPETAWYVLDYIQRGKFDFSSDELYLLDAYKCPYCKGYHLGRDKKGQRGR